MSDFVVHKGKRSADSFARHYGKTVKAVSFVTEKRTRVTLADAREGRGSCLGCGHAPCMQKDQSELALVGALEAYPGDPNLDVCPTRAIVWDDATATVVVDREACIGCGLCVARCPYGAISLDGSTTAKVMKTDPDNLVTLGAVKGEHAKPTRTGNLARLDGPAAAALPASVGGLQDANSALFVRNLLHEVGVNARVRRRGDTNMRIDAVGVSRSDRPFVAEIELSSAVLESPRALLEDVAILHARYAYAVAGIDPVSIILSLPNARSEYYQVIRDIEKVVGLRCRTVTIGALIALVWNCARLENFDGTAFATNHGAIDLSAALPITRQLLREPYPGAFTPSK